MIKAHAYKVPGGPRLLFKDLDMLVHVVVEVGSDDSVINETMSSVAEMGLEIYGRWVENGRGAWPKGTTRMLATEPDNYLGEA